ncbi:MAG: HlyD family efflux transporter periplasmic adaptor subunit [Acidobacteriota bacterium]
MRPAISRDDLALGTVKAGPIEETIASRTSRRGAHLLDRRPRRARPRPHGRSGRPGQPIVELDASETELAVGKLDDQIALKGNQEEKLRLAMRSNLASLASERQAKRLDHDYLEAKNARDRKLLEQGLVSEQDVKQSQLEVDKAALALQQNAEAGQLAKENLERELAGLTLEIAILKKEREEVGARLSEATTHARSAGVLTWVTPDVGALVRRGDVVAKVADLRAFEVVAEASDVHRSRLAPGMRASVKTATTVLGGVVGSIDPTVRSGVLTMRIALDDPAQPSLLASMRVDVFVTTSRKDNVLTLPRGPAIRGPGAQELFVIPRGTRDRARRTSVVLGASTFESYEVVSGLAEGDEVVLNDLREHAHRKEIWIR